MDKKYIIVLFFTCVTTTCTPLRNYFWATYSSLQNRADTGFWFSQVLNDNPSVYSYRGYVRYLFEAGRFDEVYQLASIIESKFPQDIPLQLILSTVLLRKGERSRSEKIILTLNREHPEHQEVALRTAYIFLEKKELENAISTLTLCLDKTVRQPHDFILYFTQAQIFVQMQRLAEADSAIKKAMELVPTFDKGWLLFALIKEEQNEIDEAIKGYAKFLELTKVPFKEIEQHLLLLKIRAGQNTAGNLGVQLPSVCIQRALLFFKNREYQKALGVIDQCIARDKNDKQSKLLKIDILLALEQGEYVVDTIVAWIAEEESVEGWSDLLLLIAKNQLNRDIVSKRLQEHAKERAAIGDFLFFCCGEIYLHTNEPMQAASFFERALAVSARHSIRKKIFVMLASLYQREQKVKELQRVVSNAYAQYSNDPICIYTYASYLFRHEKNFSKAERLLKKAVEYDPTNLQYLDEYAELLFVQKKYARAEQVARKALEYATGHTTTITRLEQILRAQQKDTEADQLLSQSTTQSKR